MAQKIPFLKLLSGCPVQSGMAEALSGWEVTGMQVNRHSRIIRAQVTCPVLPEEETRRSAGAALAAAYQAAGVELELTASEPVPPPAAVGEPPLPEAPPPEEIPLPEPPPEKEALPPPEEDPAMAAFRRTEELRRAAMKNIKTAAPREKKEKKQDKQIFGKYGIRGEPVPMSGLSLEMGNVVVEGSIFAVDHKELRGGRWVISFDVTDYTGSVRVHKFLQQGGADVAGLIH
ncbi:MAG: PolC-type DNA polymerase III, partial [Clostridiales bacterium]|nr:PolC-type DNA polymerase III [Clostridiales bacterium]